MSAVAKQKKQLSELHKNIWNIACDFWGKMEADDYKDYVLGLLFYRYLSERTERMVESLLEADDGMTYELAFENEEYKEAIISQLLGITGFVIEPKYLFSNMFDMINVTKEGFDIEYLQKAINSLTESTLGQESQTTFDGIFEDMDLNSSKLGKSVKDRSELVEKAITNIGLIDFPYDEDLGDIMGDAYEYMIGKFAAGAGKKSGSYYTPSAVGHLLARITTIDKPKALNALDACGGSGSLLLTLKKYSEVTNLYYQELTTSTFNLARMNMLLHGVGYQNFHMDNNDSLKYPAFTDVMQDIIVANPPYSQNWSSDKSYLSDERFSNYGVLAPKSKADFAFVLSMFNTLKDDGVMAVVLPHGVLFRGGAEAKIREKLLEDNNIDAVIGLPKDIFFGTGIPTCVLILKKNRNVGQDVLFIDASREYEDGKNQKFLRDKDIDKIVETYEKRETVDKYSNKVYFEDLKENDFNMNIPLYVDTFEEEEPIDLEEVGKKINDTKDRIKDIDDKLYGYFKELGIEGILKW